MKTRKKKNKIQKKGKITNRKTKRGEFYIKFVAKINYLNLTILFLSLVLQLVQNKVNKLKNFSSYIFGTD